MIGLFVRAAIGLAAFAGVDKWTNGGAGKALKGAFDGGAKALTGGGDKKPDGSPADKADKSNNPLSTLFGGGSSPEQKKDDGFDFMKLATEFGLPVLGGVFGGGALGGVINKLMGGGNNDFMTKIITGLVIAAGIYLAQKFLFKDDFNSKADDHHAPAVEIKPTTPLTLTSAPAPEPTAT